MALQTPPANSILVDINGRLASFFVWLDGQQAAHRRTSFSDSDIQEIALLLNHLDEAWSKVPRTYIVLRAIGRLDLLNTLISLGFTDHWFPVTERGLPASISPSVKVEFVQAQPLILTKSVDLDKGEDGRHGHFC
jgi:hypothetical protein